MQKTSLSTSATPGKKQQFSTKQPYEPVSQADRIAFKMSPIKGITIKLK